jgi:hypothetical protein
MRFPGSSVHKFISFTVPVNARAIREARLSLPDLNNNSVATDTSSD